MQIGRRELITASVAMVGAAALRAQDKPRQMYGLIGKMTAVDGQRDALIAILLEGIHDMPGCLSYVVAKDATDVNGIWITEVWDSKASHDASLALPAVRNAIGRAKPLIAGLSDGTTTVPVGGHGLPG